MQLADLRRAMEEQANSGAPIHLTIECDLVTQIDSTARRGTHAQLLLGVGSGLDRSTQQLNTSAHPRILCILQ